MSPHDRIQILHQALEERILILDGAMGTAIQDCELGPEDFGGPHYEGSGFGHHREQLVQRDRE